MSAGADDGPAGAVAVRYWGGALVRKERGASERAYAPGATCRLPGETTPRTARGMSAYFAELYDAVPDLAFAMLDVVAQGDEVAVRWHVSGTFAGPGRLSGIAPNGRHLDLEGIDRARVTAAGLLTDVVSYFDTGTLGRQLGVLPPAGSRAERAAVRLANLATRARRARGSRGRG